MTRDEVVQAIKKVCEELGIERLSQREFKRATGIGESVVAKHFDRWSEACLAADIECMPRPKLNGNYGPSKKECLDDLARVADIFGKPTLTRAEYALHGKWPSISPFRRHFGSWLDALVAADLRTSPRYRPDTEFADLSKDFVRVADELGRIPTIRELRRRSQRHWSRQAKKCGGFKVLKARVAEWCLSTESGARRPLSPHLKNELETLRAQCNTSNTAGKSTTPHRLGATFKFRQFAYEPTQEQDVVAMFNSVAGELGFEILANRTKFPDCLARRRQPGKRAHFLECRIEFEFKSRDFKTHKHPASQCDLIVCWKHNWKDCPIEVLELSSEIQGLPNP